MRTYTQSGPRDSRREDALTVWSTLHREREGDRQRASERDRKREVGRERDSRASACITARGGPSLFSDCVRPASRAKFVVRPLFGLVNLLARAALPAAHFPWRDLPTNSRSVYLQRFVASDSRVGIFLERPFVCLCDRLHETKGYINRMFALRSPSGGNTRYCVVQ